MFQLHPGCKPGQMGPRNRPGKYIMNRKGDFSVVRPNCALDFPASESPNRTAWIESTTCATTAVGKPSPQPIFHCVFLDQATSESFCHEFVRRREQSLDVSGQAQIQRSLLPHNRLGCFHDSLPCRGRYHLQLVGSLTLRFVIAVLSDRPFR